MFEQDYLMRMLIAFYDAIRRSIEREEKDKDPRGAAEMLENAITDATDIDGATLLSLAPESVAGVLQISGVEPRVTEYIARSMMLQSGYLAEAGEADMAAVRMQQARALADAYGFYLPDNPKDLSDLIDEEEAEAESAAAEGPVAEAGDGEAGFEDAEEGDARA